MAIAIMQLKYLIVYYMFSAELVPILRLSQEVVEVMVRVDAGAWYFYLPVLSCMAVRTIL
jgi:hypothetical protein